MAIYQPLNESALIKCFQGPLWVEKKMMTWISVSMSVLQVSNDIHQSGTDQPNRQLCPITPYVANLCPITHHADNLSPITRHGKPLCHASVLFSTSVQLTERAEKQRSARLARTSFIYFQLFILFPFPVWNFETFILVSLAGKTQDYSRLRHLEPWNTKKILHIWQPLTQLSLIHFERGNIVRIVSIHLIGKKWGFCRGISTEFVPLEETNRWRKF